MAIFNNQPEAHMAFPFPLVPEANLYRSQIAQVHAEYTTHHDAYLQKANEVENLTAAWAERHVQLIKVDVDSNKELEKTPEALKKEFGEKVEIYYGYAKIREDSLRIASLYDQVLSRLLPYNSWFYGPAPSSLDPKTLEVLQNLEVLNIDTAKEAYEQVFTQEVNRLKEEREKMQSIYNQMKLPVRRLRQALEPLGELCSLGHGFRVPAVINWGVGLTPRVKEALEEYIKTISQN